MNARQALKALLDQIEACGPIEPISAISMDLVDNARKAVDAPFGLTIEQEPKYTVNDDGRIINRVTGIAIPDDEPIMLFRAKDTNAIEGVRRYGDRLNEKRGNNQHQVTVFQRYQAFIAFKEQHPERMREPD